MHTPHVMSGGRYPVLRSLAILYLIGAAVAAIGGVVAAVWALIWAPLTTSDRLVMAGSALAATFFVVISMLAIAEVLKLFIDVEHNTRLTAVAAMQRVAVVPPSDAIAAAAAMSGDGGVRAPSRLDALDDETAEAALLRGH